MDDKILENATPRPWYRLEVPDVAGWDETEQAKDVLAKVKESL